MRETIGRRLRVRCVVPRTRDFITHSRVPAASPRASASSMTALRWVSDEHLCRTQLRPVVVPVAAKPDHVLPALFRQIPMKSKVLAIESAWPSGRAAPRMGLPAERPARQSWWASATNRHRGPPCRGSRRRTPRPRQCPPEPGQRIARSRQPPGRRARWPHRRSRARATKRFQKRRGDLRCFDDEVTGRRATAMVRAGNTSVGARRPAGWAQDKAFPGRHCAVAAFKARRPCTGNRSGGSMADR